MEGSTALQSRFQIEFLYVNNVGFRNYFGKYLKAETMEWTSSEAGREEILSLEQSDKYVSFKSSDGAYLTVTDENDLNFKISTLVEDSQKFVIDKHCRPGKAMFYFQLTKMRMR